MIPDSKSNNKLSKSFSWLNCTQFLGALNDNIFKLLLVFALISIAGADSAGVVSATAGAVFVIPFLIFYVPAGVLADRISKQRIVIYAKVAEVMVMIIGSIAFFNKSEPILYLTLFLMSSQSAFFGPSKYGIIPELVRKDQLSRANSYLEALTYLAVIIGTALAPALSQLMSFDYGMASLFCIAVAVSGLFSSLSIERTQPVTGSKKALTFLSDIGYTLRAIRDDKYLIMSVFGAAFFMFVGAFAQINLIPYGMEVLALDQVRSGYLFVAAALGIGTGSFIAGRMSGRNIEMGIVPLGAMGLAVSNLALYLAPSNVFFVMIVTTCFGISAGLFIVPVHSFIQFQSPKNIVGKVIAVSGFLGWIGVLLASGLVYLLSAPLGRPSHEGFLFTGVLTVVFTALAIKFLPDFLLRFCIVFITRLFYRIKVYGAENVPVQGPALLVPNHVTWMDPFLIPATQQRRIRFLMDRPFYEKRFLNPFFRLMGVIPVSPTDSPKEIVRSLRKARSAINEGYMVCIFAEGALTRNGMMREFRGGMEFILKGSECPVIPVYIGGAWGSIFSYAHGRLFSRFPVKVPYPITILFGTAMPAASRVVDVKQAVAELETSYYELNRDIKDSLGRAFVESARKHWRRKAILDTTGKKLSYGKLLISSVALSCLVKKHLNGQEKVGLLLPPSAGAVLANLALVLSGKIPVNLNYTAPISSIESAIAQCGIESVITSSNFLQKLRLEISPDKIYIDEIIHELTAKNKLLALFKACFIPSGFFIPNRVTDAHSIATIIFSSGSTGEAKGVMLSHHNILSNVEAVGMVLPVTEKDNICSALPFFHSLGFTATLWLPLLRGFSASYHFNPMEGAKIAEVTRTNRSTILVAAPTFLLSYIHRAAPEDFRTLRLVLTGAEKLKPRIADRFKEKFGIRPMEGYGVTEMSPVISLNVPDVEIDDVKHTGVKSGSVGHPLPGVAVKIVDPESRNPLPLGESGLIIAKGPNVMLGYLNSPDESADVIRDGWYSTGDIGYLDNDGFIFITDRIARFSKIGGEMVPHKGIEDEFYKHLNNEEPLLAVTSIADERKGEKLVVLHTKAAGGSDLLQQIIGKSSIPNLWKPAGDCYIELEELPILGSGKMDIKRMQQIARERLTGKLF